MINAMTQNIKSKNSKVIDGKFQNKFLQHQLQGWFNRLRVKLKSVISGTHLHLMREI
jgi:hypothetical protein